jgi:trans-L-3-hydroxyproline dehydratase
MREGLVESVRFLNVPSYAAALDESVSVPGMGSVRYDLAFGGAYYAFVNAADLGLRCRVEHAADLIRAAMAIKQELMRTRPIEHPFERDLGFLYGVIFAGPPEDATNHSRHVCVFADGQIDRSPTGTGVSARAAILHARGEIAARQSIVIESIVGSRFRVCVAQTTSFGPHAAVVPEVEGRAFLTGRHEFWIDPRDPLREGFVLR